MAKTILNEDSTIKVNLSNESSLSVNMSVDSTNYIPGYKEAEEQRRKNEEQRIVNELERIANEQERENYFEDMQQKVESGYFNGEPGPEGPAGPPGKNGTFEELTEEQKASLKGEKGEPGEPGEPGKDAPKYIAGTNIEITEDNVINCTATGGGGGTLTEELDPTVPDYVKNITEADIEKWNSGTGGSGFDGDYNNLTNKPTELSQFNNDVGYITNDEETDPTVPQHVKNITEGNISSWNNKAEASSIPTKTSQLTNDSGFKTTDNNTTYTLSKDGSTVKLTGSDGSSSTVTVTEGGGATYDVATTSKNGLMSASDKSKLDGIASGANKTTVDSALSSSSTNPVQNKVVNSALGNKQNKVLSGTGVPASSTGSNGDVYFRTDGGDSEVYSTSETVIGTWINGKTIYRKVIDFGNLPNATIKTVSTGYSASAITIIRMYGFARYYDSSARVTFPLPYSSTILEENIKMAVLNGNIEIATQFNRSAGYAYVIIEYIKSDSK